MNDPNNYDYLLVVGPGRSGTELLYRNLEKSPAVVFPEIKEGYYYRSLRQFKKAVRRARDDKKILGDVANLAYNDPELAEKVRQIRDQGYRALILLVLREHRERAVSMMQFKASRGEISALLGRKQLENIVVRDRLTRDNLLNIYGLDVDVLAVEFETLTDDIQSVLDCIARLCGVACFPATDRQVLNKSEYSRHILLSAAAKLLALMLRRLGLRRLLHRLKNSRAVRHLFLVPWSENAHKPTLSDESVKILETSRQECRAAVKDNSKRLRDGIWLRKVNKAPPPPP